MYSTVFRGENQTNARLWIAQSKRLGFLCNKSSVNTPSGLFCITGNALRLALILSQLYCTVYSTYYCRVVCLLSIGLSAFAWLSKLFFHLSSNRYPSTSSSEEGIPVEATEPEGSQSAPTVQYKNLPYYARENRVLNWLQTESQIFYGAPSL
jgi:hypothetical protein